MKDIIIRAGTVLLYTSAVIAALAAISIAASVIGYQAFKPWVLAFGALAIFIFLSGILLRLWYPEAPLEEAPEWQYHTTSTGLAVHDYTAKKRGKPVWYIRLARQARTAINFF